MNLIPKRNRQIATAAFDDFMIKLISEEELIDQAGKINLRILNRLAKDMGCRVHSLSLTIQKACCRLSSETFTGGLPKEEEDAIILAAAKYRIKKIDVPLENFGREFGNVAARMNDRNPALRLKREELFQYVYPIYLDVVEEVFALAI
jgi:hypothetical protein